MNRKLGFGIIGTGAIAGTHIAAIRQIKEAEVIAVYNPNKEHAAVAEVDYKVKAFSDLDEFLSRPEIDVVSICTSSGQHMEPAIAAAQRGKHVLVEKPIEITLGRAEQLIQVCRENNVQLGVVFQNRFNPGYITLKKAVEEGLLGKLLMGNAYINWFRESSYYSSSKWKGTFRGDGGGALINQGIHTIDLLLDIMGDVHSVFGQIKTVLYPIEGEDLASAIVNFKSGALGNITGGTSLYPGYPERLEIYGTEGSVILEAGKIREMNIKGKPKQEINAEQKESSGSSDPMAIGHQLHIAQIEDMIQAINENRDPKVTGEIAIKSLGLIMGIYQSSKENNLIEIH